jgi:hypothetical protein
MWTSLDDRAWDKNAVAAGYAFLSNSGDPVMPKARGEAWTLEAWVKPDVRAVGWTPLIGQQNDADTNTGRQNIWLNSGEITVIGPNDQLGTGIYLPVSKWSHIAWVMNTPNGSFQSTSQLYLDGSLVWSSTFTRSDTGPFFTVGGSRQREGTPEVGTFDGQIDQVKVWGVALSSTQVGNSMHAHGSTFTGAPGASCSTGLRAHYDFNEFATGSVIDRSGCGKTLAFNNAVAGSYAESDFTSAGIIETSTAFSALQNVVKFNRSYLTAAGGWTTPPGVTNFKALVVGGGGAGGTVASGSSGGGGGGQVQESLLRDRKSVV